MFLQWVPFRTFSKINVRHFLTWQSVKKTKGIAKTLLVPSDWGLDHLNRNNFLFLYSRYFCKWVKKDLYESGLINWGQCSVSNFILCFYFIQMIHILIDWSWVFKLTIISREIINSVSFGLLGVEWIPVRLLHFHHLNSGFRRNAVGSLRKLIISYGIGMIVSVDESGFGIIHFDRYCFSLNWW